MENGPVKGNLKVVVVVVVVAVVVVVVVVLFYLCVFQLEAAAVMARGRRLMQLSGIGKLCSSVTDIVAF